MLGYLILLFTVVPLLELALLLEIGRQIGVFPTIAIVIVTGVAGAFLARSQGIAVLRSVEDELNRGAMPAENIVDGAMILAGGALLLTPGLITDLAGFGCLVPFTRRLLKLWLSKKMKAVISQGRVVHISRFR